ncbi:hypothetical protein ECPA9_2996, partial [Escherichia coli PA9]
MPEADS